MWPPVVTTTDSSGAAVPDPWFAFSQAPEITEPSSDEFTDAVLNPAWTPVLHSALTVPIVPIGPVDLLGCGVGPAVKMTPNYQGTWLAWQGADGGIIRNFEMPPILQLRFRIATPASVPDNLFGFGNLYVGNVVGGIPDVTNDYARLGWTQTGGQGFWLSTGRQAGGGGFDTQGPNAFGTQRNLEMIVVIVAGVDPGNSETRWYVKDGAAVSLVQRHVCGVGVGNPAYAYLRFSNTFSVTDGNNRNAVGLCDYLRFRLDADVLAE